MGTSCQHPRTADPVTDPPHTHTHTCHACAATHWRQPGPRVTPHPQEVTRVLSPACVENFYSAPVGFRCRQHPSACHSCGWTAGSQSAFGWSGSGQPSPSQAPDMWPWVRPDWSGHPAHLAMSVRTLGPWDRLALLLDGVLPRYPAQYGRTTVGGHPILCSPFSTC